MPGTQRVRVSQSPVIGPQWKNPKGVPVCAILFGNRRPNLVQLVAEAFSWKHGVSMGSVNGSQTPLTRHHSVDTRRQSAVNSHQTPDTGHHSASTGHQTLVTRH